MTENLIYSTKYVTYTREELLEKVSSQMSDKRFQHVLRVEKKALELARKYPVDLEKVSIAALTHDYAKERPDDEMIDWIKQYHLDSDLLAYGNAIWHGIVGALMVHEELNINDLSILEAIEYHTTGAKQMDQLAKIIYVADYIEDGRDFPVVNKAREIANQNLDEAVAFETKQTLRHLIDTEKKIYPKVIETYNAWVIKQ